VEKKRIAFSIPLLAWIRRSLNEFSIRVADLSPEIAVESTLLRDFHKDPADQIIVAASRILEMPLVTADKRILEFPEVDTIW
jgi:PIN domain nuclease of toxin-antitoxin system